MYSLITKILICFVVATAAWVVNDYYEQKEYMEIMGRRERALDEENRQRDLEQLRKEQNGQSD